MNKRGFRLFGTFLLAAVLVLLSFGGRTVSAATEETLPENENSVYCIVPLHAGGTALDVPPDGSYLQIYNAHRNKNQAWKLIPYEGYYLIESVSTGQVIQSNSPNSLTGAGLHTERRSNRDGQLWKLEAAGDGSYYIRIKANESYVMDVDGFGDHETRVVTHKINYGMNQRFRLIQLSPVEEMAFWGAERTDANGSDWDLWDGSSDTGWYYANRNARTFTISGAAALAGLSQLVRDGVCDFAGRTILLERDLNLCGIEWKKIGQPDRPFKGSFNGNGHAIVGLSITGTDSDVGFFGCMDGGCISNFAIKGSVSGDWNTGGVAGVVNAGHIVNVYSEVSLSRATDDNEGGICGRLGSKGLIDHCTQNARVNSGDQEPDRGGIAGYACGVIRYCVNRQSVDCNWDCAGGIAGECAGGKIEFCANYGQISGGGDLQYAGGICGKTTGDARIFGCFNSGLVFSDDDDEIGGILGERNDSSKVFCCVNTGRVSGDDQIGGIVGSGWCAYCFNAGVVTGDDDTGAVSGWAVALPWTRALYGTADRLHGHGNDNGSEWVSAEDVISGKLCFDLNGRENTMDFQGSYELYETVFFQNLGGSIFPVFSGQNVIYQDGNYRNDAYEVTAEYDRSCGTVTGTGTYASGEVRLRAVPADGCVFDHFEVSRTKVGSGDLKNGVGDFPVQETVEYPQPEILLTGNIDSSFHVKACFGIYDETPEDQRIRVELELECSDDTDGWNAPTVPVYLIDSAGEKHLWEVPKDSLDGEGKKVSRTFDLGTSSPVAVEAWPDFGGGFTFHDLGLIARIRINDMTQAIGSSEVMIRSYPFISSKYGNDYMHITFDDAGNASVGILAEDGSLNVLGTYTSIKEAWAAAQVLGKRAAVRLDSVWLTADHLQIDSGEMTLDLNGYPLIRTMKKAAKNGEVIRINSGAVLHVVDSAPSRKSCSAFYGGSIQGGRSSSGAGLIEVLGTLDMKGGTLYNGGSTEEGGALRVNGTASLTGTLISDCWANQAAIVDNDGGAIAMQNSAVVSLKDCTIRNCRANENGGAIHMEESGTALSLEDTRIYACSVNDENGGAIFQEGGSLRFIGGTVQNCRSSSGYGGAIAQKDTPSKNERSLYCKNVAFLGNTAKGRAGAVYSNASDNNWLIGCAFVNNISGKNGGAVCIKGGSHLYMEDCALTANAAEDSGGGIYAEENAALDLYGKTIVRENDGSGSMDNLVLAREARLCDQGIKPGSEIHLRSTNDGAVVLGNSQYPVSEYHLKNYFVGDGVTLELTDTRTVETKLNASAFAGGNVRFLVVACAAALLIGAGVFLIQKKRKGGRP